MQEKSWELSKKAEKIILDRVKDRLVDVVYREDDADEYARIARERLGLFYENLVFAALDLGVKKGRALDLGTQFGLCAISLAKQHYDFDITSFQESVRFTKSSRSFAEKDMVDERIEWVMGNHEALPFEDGSFDLIVSGFDMHHWENPVQVMSEIGRVLKANGVLLIADFRRDAFSPVVPVLKAISYLDRKHKIYDEMRHSFAASYLKSEVLELLACSGLEGCEVSNDAQFFYVRKAKKTKKHVMAEFSNR
jgi:ubiquinone/menaquinone biosynthesis C-methylase UbiE